MVRIKPNMSTLMAPILFQSYPISVSLRCTSEDLRKGIFYERPKVLRHTNKEENLQFLDVSLNQDGQAGLPLSNVISLPDRMSVYDVVGGCLQRHRNGPISESDGTTVSYILAFSERPLLANNGHERAFRLRRFTPESGHPEF